ncbi:MAG TPA: trypsin-like serine protease [Actinomycetota bacterium]|nr:trypsin-like serine protease [Actinomycetota bacterium]
MRRFTVGALIAVVMWVTPAFAITSGQPDEGRHPEVGALVGTFEGETYPYCSGALISPTVFLTAAHCDIDEAVDGDPVTVTFEERYTSRAKLHRGNFYAHPEAWHDSADAKDIAVVVFRRPIKGIQPAQLPTEGLLDEMSANGTLTQSTRFTSVGYGSTGFTNQPGGPAPTYPDARMFAVGSFNSLNSYWLRLSMNEAHDDGGTCYGDSGGPNYLGAGANETDIIVGTTITGDVLCKSTNVTYRTDTDSARAFLARFVTLP